MVGFLRLTAVLPRALRLFPRISDSSLFPIRDDFPRRTCWAWIYPDTYQARQHFLSRRGQCVYGQQYRWIRTPSSEVTYAADLETPTQLQWKVLKRTIEPFASLPRRVSSAHNGQAGISRALPS